MAQKTLIYWMAFAVMGLLLTAGCTPQSAPEEPTPTQAILVPTLVPTEAEVLPTAVAELATQTPPPTNTPPPTPTTFVTNTPIPPTAVPTHTPTPAAEPDVQPKEQFIVVGVESDDTLNVRSGAGVDNDVVGELPYNAVGVDLLAEDVLVDGSPWQEIEYEEIRGWVNRSFIGVQVGERGDSAEAAHAIITALKDQDYETLATFVHPEKGVRFSPYAFVEETQIVLSSAEIAELADNSDIYRWGTFDGEGGPIELTFADYYQRFIYDVNFFRPHTIGYNQFVGFGSMINNIEEVYPDSSTVEYHFPGFEEDFGGLDWRSLILVMEEVDGEWKLVAIVHSEWAT